MNREAATTQRHEETSQMRRGEAYNATSETPEQLPTSDKPAETQKTSSFQIGLSSISIEIMLDPVNTQQVCRKELYSELV